MIDVVEVTESHPSSIAPRLLGVAAALLLVLGVVAAAIGKDDGASPVELLGAAPDALAETGTGRLTITSTVPGVGSVTGHGVVDFRTGDTELTMGFGGTDMTMVKLGDSFFMRLPEALHLPKPWIKIAVPTAAPAQASPFSAGSAAGVVDALRGVGEVTEEGRETINGVPATHYGVVVDVQRALDAVPAEQRAELERTFGTVPSSPDTLPMEVWLSDDGLPVRTEVTVKMGTFESTTRVDLTDFGVDVDIQAPPADQVLEVKDVAELAQLFPGGQAPPQ